MVVAGILPHRTPRRLPCGAPSVSGTPRRPEETRGSTSSVARARRTAARRESAAPSSCADPGPHEVRCAREVLTDEHLVHETNGAVEGKVLGVAQSLGRSV